MAVPLSLNPSDRRRYRQLLREYPTDEYLTPLPDYRKTIRATAEGIGMPIVLGAHGEPVWALAPDIRLPLNGSWRTLHRKVCRAVRLARHCKFELGALVEDAPRSELEIVKLEELAEGDGPQARLARHVRTALTTTWPPSAANDGAAADPYRQAAFDLLWGLSVEAFGTHASELRHVGYDFGPSVTVGTSRWVSLEDDGVSVCRGRSPYRRLKILFPVHRSVLPNRDMIREAALPPFDPSLVLFADDD